MRKNNLKVLFVASECTPIAKVGGLGDVIGSLPKALDKLGLDVRIVLPKYGIIDEKKYPSKLVASGIRVNEEKINVYRTFLPQSKIILYFLENEKYFNENDIYFKRTAFVGSLKEIERFLFLSKAVLETFSSIDWFPEIIHCHDWHAAILPVLIKIKKLKIKTLLTIHNLANQGKWNPKEILDFLGLKGNEIESLGVRDKNDDFNIFQQGILNADILNTVSPTYGKEVLTEEYGAGLEKELKAREDSLYGILNGIDVDFFDPETDHNIKVNYSLKNFERKKENKIELQKIAGFPRNKNNPFIGFINRLTSQKGVDLIIDIIPELVKMSIQLIILGVGLAGYEKKLVELGKKYPKNISCQIKFDPILAQRIYAGCDIFLMPSEFEPCGLGQMIALRYGTIPVVRKTGGLADTVKNKINGFVFEKYKSEALLRVLKETLKCYQKQKNWNEIIKRAMSGDFSWQKSAKEYLKLYNKLVKTLKNY
jgi:starch synthase